MSGSARLTTVVVCSPEAALLEAISERLGKDGYAPLPASDALTASRLCRLTRPDLLIVDLGLPDGAAPALLRERAQHRDFSEVGMLALAGKTDSIAMLREDPELAPDEYLGCPFDLDELGSRLRSILRRRHSGDERVVRLGELVIDPPRHKVTLGATEVHLSRKEFLLLRVLASDPTRVFSKDELLREIWGVGHLGDRTRSLDATRVGCAEILTRGTGDLSSTAGASGIGSSIPPMTPPREGARTDDASLGPSRCQFGAWGFLPH
jgi:DNA-binding response OmpR family regulator